VPQQGLLAAAAVSLPSTVAVVPTEAVEPLPLRSPSAAGPGIIAEITKNTLISQTI
jgi:hypothetical protein